MTAVYDEIEIEDFEYEAENKTYYYPCPCGDRFQISLVSTVGGMTKDGTPLTFYH